MGKDEMLQVVGDYCRHLKCKVPFGMDILVMTGGEDSWEGIQISQSEDHSNCRWLEQRQRTKNSSAIGLRKCLDQS